MSGPTPSSIRTSADISDSTASGRAVLTGTPAQGASALGLGVGDSPTFTSLSLSGTISIGGNAVLTNGGGFTYIRDGSGTINAIAVGSNDPTNYFNNTNHYFSSRNGSTVYGFFNAAALTLNVPLKVPSYTVAGLPNPGSAGRIAWASNGRAFNGVGTLESAGAGSGVLVTDNGSAWRVAGTNQTVQA